MKQPDDRVYLQHILDAATRISEYLKGVSEAKFHESHLLQDGVIRQIQIVGEAAKRVSRDFCNQYPAVPWRDIAGMRDKLVHDYFGVDVGMVWVTAIEDLPELRKQIAEILANL